MQEVTIFLEGRATMTCHKQTVMHIVGIYTFHINKHKGTNAQKVFKK